jgi:methionine-rich copper-binding protein CopC
MRFSSVILIGVAALGIAVFGAALAHSKFKTSSPKNNSTVKVMPSSVKIEFNSGVDTQFGIFKVYRLEKPPTNSQAIEAAAEKMANTMLPKKNDASARADAGAVNKGVTKSLEIKLKPKLQPGVYTVMWRAIGEDTHVIEGSLWFKYKP